MKYVNMTPHAVTVNGKTFEPSGETIRLVEKAKVVDTVEGVEFFSVDYGVDEGTMPKQTDDTLYIVSSMVKDAVPYRHDFVVPYGFIRDDAGKIIGARGFRV